MSQNEYVYFEGDSVGCIYFLREGNCGFVLPKHSNAKYIDIEKRSHFGVHDIIGYICESENNADKDNWIHQKGKLTRQFTCLADQSSQLLTLSIDDLNRMKMEFLDSYHELFEEAMKSLDLALMLKLRAIRDCQIFQAEWYERPEVKEYLEKEQCESESEEHVP
jgi:CRP-like cAMP-binding protein